MQKSLAFLFPGQGSQTVGMGKSLYDEFPEAHARFDQANAILGYLISDLCFNGPEQSLKQTENQQPALFLCAAAAVDVLRGRGIEPACVAGHSLGEYGALYAAGVFDFETGLCLVAQRGKAMADAGKAAPGTMAAILGLDLETLENICSEASGACHTVVVANDNSPGQTVISGSPDAVERACQLAKAAGAKRALPLPVSGAFHSPLVQPAREVMQKALAGVQLKKPKCTFIPNFTAEPLDDPEKIRQSLIEQVTSRVRWVETVCKIAGLGITAALEVGPGSVLAGLVKRIEPALVVSPAGTAADIRALR